jgi:Luciferase
MRLVEDTEWGAPLRRELAGVARLEETASRFGSARRLAWRAGGREIAHLHAQPFVDLRLPAPARKAIAGDPRLVHRAGRSEWIECRMETAEDVRFVAALIRRIAKAAPLRRRP